MTHAFQHLMARATRLTRDGRLADATAAIQAALAGAQAPAGAPAPTGDPGVIDVEARHVPDAVDAPPCANPVPPPRGPAGVAPGEARFLSGNHVEGVVHRPYRLFVPPATGALQPLLLMLHGCTQDPDDFARGTRMNEAALASGMLVLYPQQIQRANSSGCWNWFKHNHQRRDRGEPAALADMVRNVMGNHPVDPQRVFVAGLSAGGAMAAVMGQAYPDLFAAVGVHSGIPTGVASDLPSALAAMQGQRAPPACAAPAGPPLIVFHGDQDSTVQAVNGENLLANCIGARGDAVEALRGQVAGGRTYTRSIHRDAAGRLRAEHWVVHGAGHAWSGGSPQGSYTDPAGPDASAQMVRFFLAVTTGR